MWFLHSGARAPQRSSSPLPQNLPSSPGANRKYTVQNDKDEEIINLFILLEANQKIIFNYMEHYSV